MHTQTTTRKGTLRTARRGIEITAVIAAAICVCSGADAASDTKTTLPGGATSLSEQFSDWTLACAAGKGATSCAVSQTQARRDGQRILEIRLDPTIKDKAYAAQITLPFGLELAKGAVLQKDDKSPILEGSFKTCLPAGCVVAISLDQKTLSGLYEVKNIQIAAVSTAGAQMVFPVSMNGLKAAMERGATLATAR